MNYKNLLNTLEFSPKEMPREKNEVKKHYL